MSCWSHSRLADREMEPFSKLTSRPSQKQVYYTVWAFFAPVLTLVLLIRVIISPFRLWRVNFLLERLYFFTLLPFLLSSKHRLHLDAAGELFVNILGVCVCVRNHIINHRKRLNPVFVSLSTFQHLNSLFCRLWFLYQVPLPGYLISMTIVTMDIQDSPSSDGCEKDWLDIGGVKWVVKLNRSVHKTV